MNDKLLVTDINDVNKSKGQVMEKIVDNTLNKSKTIEKEADKSQSTTYY